MHTRFVQNIGIFVWIDQPRLEHRRSKSIQYGLVAGKIGIVHKNHTHTLTWKMWPKNNKQWQPHHAEILTRGFCVHMNPIKPL